MITVDELKRKYSCCYCGKYPVNKTLEETEYSIYEYSVCPFCGFEAVDGEEAIKERHEN